MTVWDTLFDTGADGRQRGWRDIVADARAGGGKPARAARRARFKTPAPTRRLVLAWRKGSALARPLQAVAATLGKARRSLP